MTLHEALTRQSIRRPAAVAVRCGRQSLTYGQLQAAVEGLAGALAGLGLARGGRAAVLLPNSPAFVISYLAVPLAGASVVPVNVMYRPDEVLHILSDCRASVLIAAEPLRPLVEALRAKMPQLRVVLAGEGPVGGGEVSLAALCGSAPAPRVPVGADDVAVILYTSGTSGRPKGVMLTHANLLANAASCGQVLDVGPNDCFVTALPLFHAFAAMVCLVLPLTVGGRIHILERFVPASLLATLKTSGATLFAGVPSMFALMLRTPAESRPDLSALRTCVSGGAPLSPEIWTAFEQAFGALLVEGYGLTEAAPVVAVNPPMGLRKVGSIGPPLAGIEVRLVDDRGADVPVGEVGELLLRGANVMKGYLNQPEETAAVLEDGWLRTGDLARRDADGYLYIAGRKKDLILVGGLNVYPGEVERVLVEHPAVLEAAAFGVPDESRGEAVWAAVVLRGGQSADEKQLQAFCREKLAAYKVPRVIRLCQELPRSAVGKVLRRVLAEQATRESP